MIKGTEIYRRELIELKKLLSEYRVLRIDQIYKYFWNKDAMIVKKMLKYLVRNGQAVVNVEDNIIIINSLIYEEKNPQLLAAFDVMMLFSEILGYHTKLEFPFQICFFADDIQYEIIYVEDGDEQHINAVLKETDSDDIRYLVIVEKLEQINKLRIPNVYRYCTVDKDGNVLSYVVEERAIE